MNLWIRSQDRKSLIPTPKLDIEKANDSHYIVDRYDFERGNILAKYKTEERAIEVLDEIQMFKDFFQYVELLPNNKKWEWLQRIDFKQGDSLTYEMPKE